MRTSMRHTGGALSVAGITLILIGALIGNAAAPAGAAQKDEPAAATSTTKADPKDTTTTKVDPKDTTTTTTKIDPKDTTTTTTKVDPKDTTTTTTKAEPKTPTLEVSGLCALDGTTPYFTLEVTVYGAPGATGQVVSDSNFAAPFTVGSGGSTSIVLDGRAGTNMVTLTDASGGTSSASIEIVDCTPTPMTADASALCDKGERLVAVSVEGEPGDSGVAIVDGAASRFTLGADGSADLVIGTTAEEPTVQVQSGDGTTIFGPTTITVTDCGGTTTTTQGPTTSTSEATTTTQPTTSTTGIERKPEARSATADASCTAVGPTPTYAVRVTVHGDPGATGKVTVDGVSYEYLVFDQGTAEMSVAASSDAVRVSVSDAVAGTILDTDIAVAECVESEVLGADNQAGPSVQVLGQSELPFTGPHDGPIAATGAVLLVAGALLLVAARPSDEDELDLTVGWTVRR